MVTNIEFVVYTAAAVYIIVEALKKVGVSANILALVSLVLGSVVYVSLVDLNVVNVIIGLASGALASGVYDTVTGVTRIKEVRDTLTKIFELFTKETTETKDKTTGEE